MNFQNRLSSSKISNKKIAGIGLLTAVVIILQMLGSFVRFGPFSISLVLIPIVIGSALYGVSAGLFLGAAFGLAVLVSGDASLFLAVTVPGTIITVMGKGILAGYITSVAYKFFSEKLSKTASVIISAFVCPVVNTGIFLLCCSVFFMETITGWAEGSGFGANVGAYMIFGLVGGNFLCEMAINMILSPVILRLLKISNRIH